MTTTYPLALNQLVDRLVHAARYTDQGVYSLHQRYDTSDMARIRQNARSIG